MASLKKTNSSKKRTPEDALADLAKKMGCPVKWLDDLIKFESAGWNPQARNPTSSAKGLIQFMDETAREMPCPGKGRNYLNSEEIIQMFPDVVSQLDGPVTYYFTKKYKPPYPTEQSVYMTVFYPAYRYAKPDTMFPQKDRDANPGIDTVQDYMEYVKGVPVKQRASYKRRLMERGTKPTDTIYKIEEKRLNISRDIIYENTMSDFDESSLQIGDLVFLVDPTQISFNTQNGYHYFPTIRTKGNPKLTTEEFVKNFSINLIFPNEDSINYQLLHLYAMFRRSPFVNIRNRDICEFFDSICQGTNNSKNDTYTYKWLTVALESIQVQSVEGFPNTLQATITLLPMDYRIFPGGFKALKDFSDVAYQQQLLYRDWTAIEAEYKSKQKLGIEEGSFAERTLESITYNIESSPDFRLSIPFRTYYQSLITDRYSIKDNMGNNIKTNLGRQKEDFDRCRGQIKTNLLNPYISSGNREPIVFEYDYISEDRRTTDKKLSNLRMDRQVELSSSLLKTYELTKKPEDIIRSITSVFVNDKTYYKLLKFKFDEIKNTIPTILARHGITVDIKKTEFTDIPVVATIQAIIGGLSSMAGVMSFQAAVTSISNVASGKALIDDTSESAAVRNILFNQSGTNTVGTFLWGINEIKNWLNDPKLTDLERDTRAKAFTAVMYDIENELEKQLGLATSKDEIEIVTNVNPDSPELFKVSSVPISTSKITIDNKKDVITNWSIMFANKFVSIPLDGWEYPFYQHLGCEDPALSLSITSTSEEPIDLKSKISTLSEKLHESIKFINVNAPELALYLDTRIRVNGSPGNIFEVFGIKNLIFESSNTTNIQGKPNAWTTNINFSQADLTIQDYHSISDIPTNHEILNTIAKLLLRVKQRTGIPAGGVDPSGVQPINVRSLEVIKFVDNDGNNLDLDIPTLVQMHFLLKYEHDLKKLVEETKAQSQNKYTNAVQAGLQYTGSMTYGFGVYSNPEHKGNTPINTAQPLQSTINLEKELASLGVRMSVDAEATQVLNQLINDFPEMEGTLKFLFSNFDTLLAQKFQSYTQIIQPNIGFFDRWWGNYKKNTKDALTFGIPIILTILILSTVALAATVPVGIATGATLAGISAAGSFIGGTAGVATGAFIGNSFFATLATSFSQAVKEEGKEFVSKNLSDFIISLQNLALGSVVQDFANKLIKDPIIFKEFSRLMDKKDRDAFEKISVNKGVSCYKDFDLPDLTSFDPQIIVGPDFYLYNNVVSSSQFKEYITESLKRFAKIGKLSVMMCFEEIKDYLEKYDSLLLEVGGIDQKIKDAMDLAVRESVPGQDKTSSITVIRDKLNDLIEKFGMMDVGTNQTKLSENAKKILDDYKKLYDPKSGTQPNKDRKDYEWGLKVLETQVTKLENGIKIEDMDYHKLNLVEAARMQTMISIYEVYISLDKLIRGETSSKNSNIKNQIDATKLQIENNAMMGLHKFLTKFIPVCESVTTESLLSNKDLLKEFKNIYAAGGFAKPTQNSVMLPPVYRIENTLYNNISYYIRLNSVIHEFKGKGGKINLSIIPELKYLDVWNFRAKEDNDRKTEIIQEFNKLGNPMKKDSTIKLYPTFKIFFVQENKNFQEVSFDRYFSQDAINSVEIVSNKNSASTTAIIKLSNILGNLTDRASLLRESPDFQGQSINAPEQFFLGTLDIKPGTMIIIKMGYGPYDRLLQTVFNGRIIEMNAGPIVEMVCQSFGAQLNHYIQAEKFGFFSSEREYGDIASSLLDMIPGLEKLGKPVPFGMVSTNTFTGKNLRNLRGKFGEKFLMSNLIGNLTSIMMTQDNPRDENIFLNYSIVKSSLHHPTFDWVVYDQSVWEALQEISLYHRNTIVTVRPFNDESVSRYSDLRETLVVGNKVGYYKYTDAYSLSSLNRIEVDQVITEWETIKADLPTLQDLGATARDIDAELYQLTDYKINKKGITFYKFIQKPINAMVLVHHLVRKHVAVEANINPGDLVAQWVGSNNFNLSPFEQLIAGIVNFSRSGSKNITELLGPDGTSIKFEDTYSFSSFYNILELLNNKDLKIDLSKLDLIREESYNVKVIVDNLDKQFASDPQYRKIQTHHLITDSSDIISNNIALNGSFNNLVNLYYTGEPKISTSDINRLDDDFIENKLNVWSIKAFGEQRDEFCRPLNSYQKNIDTNWFDVAGSTEQFYGTFKKIYLSKLSGKPDGVDEDIYNSLVNPTNNKDILPYWKAFPSFVTVGASLLKKEVEKMYQGTIEIVGNPLIKPLDILHIQDYTKDMHGVVEVEEVIHTFTPDRGFRTVITPNLITYDREPINLQDVQVINRIYDYANTNKYISFGLNAAAAIGSIWAAGKAAPVITPIGSTITSIIAGGGFAWNGTVGAYRRYHKFLFDKLGNILGRDCINFSALLYHGLPFMAGFDGVDYTNLKTLMNYNVANIENPITRYFAYKNSFAANMLTGMNPDELSITQGILGPLRLAAPNQ